MTSIEDTDIALKKRQQDFDDLNREMSGVGGARQKRFLNRDDDSELARRRERDLREILSEFDRLMRDPEYAKAYRETDALLRDMEQKTDAAIAKTDHDIQCAEDSHNDLMDNANHLPDGRAVFKHADGKVYDAAGNVISQDDVDTIVWKDGAPTYQDYLDSLNHMRDLQKRKDDLDRYRHDVLAPARHTIDDRDPPPSKSDIDDVRRSIEAGVPEYLKEAITGTEDRPEFKGTSDLEMPSL